jgi:hypothetical protein
MRIVNTFISDTNDIPEYTEICLRQARKHNPSVIMDFISAKPADYFKDLDINWVSQNDLIGDSLRSFREVSWFDRHGTPNTSYPSPEGFWAKTAERLFYLDEYIWQNDLTDVIHFENDVMLYEDVEKIKPTHNIMGINTSFYQTTFALAYIKNKEYYRNLCFALINIMRQGERNLLSFGFDHISEMSLLSMAEKLNNIGSFNSLPEKDNDYVFDPASYGQFLGGTNNEHGPGFTDPKHYVGQKIKSGHIEVLFGPNYPVVWDKLTDTHKKIFNLHIHSKNLGEFV